MDIETSKNDNNLDESYEEDNFEMNSEIIEEKTTPENYSTDEYNNIIMYDSDIDDCYRSFEEDLNEDTIPPLEYITEPYIQGVKSVGFGKPVHVGGIVDIIFQKQDPWVHKGKDEVLKICETAVKVLYSQGCNIQFYYSIKEKDVFAHITRPSDNSDSILWSQEFLLEFEKIAWFINAELKTIFDEYQ